MGDGLGSLIYPWSVYLMMPCFIRWILCTFMGGALTLSDVPSGGNRAVKESKHLLKGMA